jgi:hypothetical protein
MQTIRWSAVLALGLLLAACGAEEERERPPEAPMLQPGNPASDGADRPDRYGNDAGTEP